MDEWMPMPIQSCATTKWPTILIHASHHGQLGPAARPVRIAEAERAFLERAERAELISEQRLQLQDANHSDSESSSSELELALPGQPGPGPGRGLQCGSGFTMNKRILPPISLGRGTVIGQSSVGSGESGLII